MKLYKLLLLLFIGSLANMSAYAQLSAGFTATPTSGCAPLLVSFTNTTTPTGGTTYSWTFGTSGSSVLTSPSTSFTTPGTHLVTLTATNGSETSTSTMTITVFPPPDVSFTASDTVVCAGEPVVFTGSGGGSGTFTYAWGFGDGSTGTGSPITHAYSAPGHYTTTLYVTNTTTSCVASLVRPLFVEVMPAPTGGIAPITGGCNPPVSIGFASTSVGTPALTYAWTFGDGGVGSGATPSHTYGATGTYPIRLIVTDGNGCIDTVTSSVTIADLAASFTLPDTACVSSTVTFLNTSSSHTSRTWNYGDGGTSTGFNGSHSYSSPGTYTVSLNIVSGPCTATVSHTIVILPGPAATITISPDEPCPAPTTITYTGSGPGGISYDWIFEGGVMASGNPVTHTYGTNGVKNVRMVVVDPVSGCRDTVNATHNIYDIDFSATATPDSGCVPLTVLFDNDLITHVPPPGVSPYPYGVTSYTWDFGDGATGVGGSPTHTYTAVGIYTATVTVLTDNGCTDTAHVRIRVGAPPEVTFTAAPTHVCYGDYVDIVFTPVIIHGPVDEWYWEFGDGGGPVYDTSVPPLEVHHTYTLPGVFSVTVVPSYRGCRGLPYTISDYITVDSPKAIMEDSVYCSPSNRVKFWDLSMGDDTHLWIFGDGTTSTEDDPVHDYPSLGGYTVQLATYNAASGCRDTVSRTIFLEGLVPDFTTDDALVCKGESVILTSTTTGGTPSAYYWYVDGLPLGTGATSPTYTRSFTDTGWHTITLVVQNALGCLDTITKTNYILVSGPSVDFSATPLSGCSPLSVTFTDASTATSGSVLTSYLWNFGDGTTGSGTPVSHTYVPAGSYSIKCVVTDNVGCRDSLTRPLYVQVYNPIAAFTVSNRNPCVSSPVTFNITTPGVATALWDFGDGGTSTVLSPVHTYSAIGSYNVKLTITDTHGCTHDTTYTAFINVNKPTAGFTMSDSVSVCPPLTVNFTNTSTGATIYSWDLGDGSSSTALSPSNLYLASGLYPIQLIATNVYGCKDTATSAVNIFGYAGAFTYTPLQGCAPLTVHFIATLSNVPYITWDFSDGVTSATSRSDTITHVYTTAGAYVPKLLLSDNTGCQTSSIGLDTIKVDEINPKFTTEPSPVCIGMDFNFVDSSTTYWSPITTWEWTYDGITSTLASPTYSISTPGTYPVTLKVTNGWGCTGMVTRELIIDPPPVVTADPDTVVCVGDPATLHGYGAATYTWAPPATLSCTACNPTFASPTVETTYTVIGTDTKGCIDSATVTVGLRTHTTSRAWGDTAVCEGVPVQLFDTGAHTYLWLPPTGLNNNTIYNPIARPNYTTIYTVIAQLGSCIPDTNHVTVVIYPLPTVDAGPNQRLLAGSKAQLHATGTDIDSYMWWPGETLDCTQCASPVASMSVMTTYNVDVTSIHGCKASDSVTILLYCDNSQIFIPNTFTPNGDGQNDVFYPRGIGVKVIKTFRIYNRWGELMFERNNISLNDAENAWDGSYKGAGPKPGVYVYIMEALCYTGEDIVMKGDVTIIR